MAVLTYITVSAMDTGVSPSVAFYFVAIANAASLFGRYAAGLLCDRLGKATRRLLSAEFYLTYLLPSTLLGAMNVMIPFTGVAGLMTYAWPFAKSERALIAITIIYGFSSGSYVSLLANPMMDMGDTGDVGRRVGMFMTILALGALAGPPISGAIWTASGGQTAVGYYAGTCNRLCPAPRM